MTVLTLAIIFMVSCIGIIATVPDTVMAAPSIPIRINGNLELAALASSGAGTEGDPYYIDEYEIDATGYNYGIYVGNTTDYFIIEDSRIWNVDAAPDWWFAASSGIHFYNVRNGRITNTTINNTINYGILFSNDTLWCTIDNVVIWNCTLRGMTFTDADACIIRNNTIYGNSTTIHGMVFDDWSDGHHVYNNTIQETVFTGIVFNDSWVINITDNRIIGLADYTGPDAICNPMYGILAYNCAYMDITWNEISNTTIGILAEAELTYNVFENDIENNTILNSEYTGIYTQYFNNSRIHNNIIAFNFVEENATKTTGLFLGIGTNYTTVYQNYISDYATGINVTLWCGNLTLWENHLFDNTLNAYDDNTAAWTTWYFNGRGNWWDDWTTPDADYDGIVDTPRTIAGLGSNTDEYPLVIAGTPPGTTPGGGGTPAPAPVATIDPGTPPSISGDGWDISFGWLFWIGGLLIILGFAHVPIPYIQPLVMKVGGVFLIILNFIL